MAESKKVFLKQKNKKEATRVFFNLYIVWLVIAFLLGRIGGYLDTGRTGDLLALVAESTFFIILFFVWRYRVFLTHLLDSVKLSGVAEFVLLGLTITYTGEIFYYFASKSSISLLVFILRTLLWYISWYLVWWWLINKYHYSVKEVFLLAGVNGYIVEGVFLHQLPVLSPIGVFLYPLVAAAYGVMMIVPFILKENEVNLSKNNLSVTLRKKYALTLLPLITFIIPGLIWFFIIEKIFKVS